MPVAEPARNAELLRNSLIILEAWLKLDDKVKNYFFDRLE